MLLSRFHCSFPHSKTSIYCLFSRCWICFILRMYFCWNFLDFHGQFVWVNIQIDLVLAKSAKLGRVVTVVCTVHLFWFAFQAEQLYTMLQYKTIYQKMQSYYYFFSSFKSNTKEWGLFRSWYGWKKIRGIYRNHFKNIVERGPFGCLVRPRVDLCTNLWGNSAVGELELIVDVRNGRSYLPINCEAGVVDCKITKRESPSKWRGLCTCEAVRFIASKAACASPN